MTQPTPYALSYSFTDFSARTPTAQTPGIKLDAEFTHVQSTLTGVLTNLALIQRDDGALRNQLVTPDSLNPAVLLMFGAAAKWVPRGNWVTGTVYASSDLVTSSSKTYVCAVAHTAAALLATDVAAGKWILIFDSAGSTPADGTVTTAKLVDAAVTLAKLAFTTLDLVGSLRGATGLSSGIAPLGAVLHAKYAAGDVLAKVERTTAAQGAVGYQIIGANVTWTIRLAANGTSLEILNSINGSTCSISTDKQITSLGGVRSTGQAVYDTGAGITLSYAAGICNIDAFDADVSQWLDVKTRGKDVYLTASGVDVVKATSTGIDIAGTAKRNGINLGYLGLPQNIQSGSYTLALTDVGKHIYSKNVAGQTVVVPTNATVAFPVETVIVVVNNGTSPISLTCSSVTMRLAGTTLTGNRTLASKGMATILKVDTDEWFISGPGVS